MLIGIDFDNTIVCYDQAIKVLASEFFNLPIGIARTKLGVRNYLRSTGQNGAWTEFQGLLYGPGMHYAQTFEGVITTLHELAQKGHRMVIVSHRSRRPYAGPDFDLHAAAIDWVKNHLQSVGLFLDDTLGSHVNFLETRDEKISKIVNLRCDVFIDDLPEVLDAPNFPRDTVGIHFEPGATQLKKDGRIRLLHWSSLPYLLTNLR